MKSIVYNDIFIYIMFKYQDPNRGKSGQYKLFETLQGRLCFNELRNYTLSFDILDLFPEFHRK